MKNKLLRYKARRSSPRGIPSMIVDPKGDYVRYADYKKLEDDLEWANEEIKSLVDSLLDAINPCC